jgi:hypothetical protein
MNARPLAACLLSADAGAAAASRPPAEPLLPLMAFNFIMADCYIVASLGPAPSSHCRSRRHRCHHIVIGHLASLTEESVQKKKKADFFFFFTAQQIDKIKSLEQVFSNSTSGTIATKNKKRIKAVSHPVGDCQK